MRLPILIVGRKQYTSLVETLLKELFTEDPSLKRDIFIYNDLSRSTRMIRANSFYLVILDSRNDFVTNFSLAESLGKERVKPKYIVFSHNTPEATKMALLLGRGTPILSFKEPTESKTILMNILK